MDPKKTEYHSISQYAYTNNDTDQLYYVLLGIAPSTTHANSYEIRFVRGEDVPIDVGDRGIGIDEIRMAIEKIDPSPQDVGSLTNPQDSSKIVRRDSLKFPVNEKNASGESPDKKLYFAFIISPTAPNWEFDLVNLGVTAKAPVVDSTTGTSKLDNIAFFRPVANDLTELTRINIDSLSYKFDNKNHEYSGCKVVVFRVNQMKEATSADDPWANYGLNLHVTLKIASGVIVPTIFDPDIKNDGGGFGP